MPTFHSCPCLQIDPIFHFSSAHISFAFFFPAYYISGIIGIALILLFTLSGKALLDPYSYHFSHANLLA